MEKNANSLYSVVNKHEKNSIYDMLMCTCCLKEVTRTNFGKHKTTEQHKRLFERMTNETK